jgi:hypothetical protein
MKRGGKCHGLIFIRELGLNLTTFQTSFNPFFMWLGKIFFAIKGILAVLNKRLINNENPRNGLENSKL